MSQAQAVANIRAQNAQVKKAGMEGRVDSAQIFNEGNAIWKAVYAAEQFTNPETALQKANAARDEVVREALLLSSPGGVPMTPTALLATVQGMADQMQASGENSGDVSARVGQDVSVGLFTNEDGAALIEMVTAELMRRESAPPPEAVVDPLSDLSGADRTSRQQDDFLKSATDPLKRGFFGASDTLRKNFRGGTGSCSKYVRVNLKILKSSNTFVWA